MKVLPMVEPLMRTAAQVALSAATWEDPSKGVGEGGEIGPPIGLKAALDQAAKWKGGQSPSPEVTPPNQKSGWGGLSSIPPEEKTGTVSIAERAAQAEQAAGNLNRSRQAELRAEAALSRAKAELIPAEGAVEDAMMRLEAEQKESEEATAVVEREQNRLRQAEVGEREARGAIATIETRIGRLRR